jgi:hypothetical protein
MSGHAKRVVYVLMFVTVIKNREISHVIHRYTCSSWSNLQVTQSMTSTFSTNFTHLSHIYIASRNKSVAFVSRWQSHSIIWAADIHDNQLQEANVYRIDEEMQFVHSNELQEGQYWQHNVSSIIHLLELSIIRVRIWWNMTHCSSQWLSDVILQYSI